jgi:FMN phosphatase YigB (HAD superfamily)
MTRPKISVVITDLDNTLFDWVEIWGASFTALVDRLAADSGIPRDTLLDEIKVVHQRHHTSEYAFLIEELPSLQAKHPGEDIAEIYAEAIHAYRSARKKVERLYPGVLTSLKALKESGVRIVGYTESMAFYASRRVRVMGLDGALDYLYSPPDHDLPANLTPEQIRRFPADVYKFSVTQHRHTPRGELKPNPDILLKIIEEVGAKPEQCIYVGDNLMKDIAMANDVGIAGLHAAYGQAQHRDVYDLLRRVTHWSAEDVERERSIMARGTVTPKYTLFAGFSEMLALFEFVPFGQARIEKNLKEYLDAWKKVVDVQQHFNDIEMRVRGLAITALAAMLGAAAYAHKETMGLKIFGHWTSAASAIAFVTLIIWMIFYCLDRFWYHRLLYGAVKAGSELEKAIRAVMPELDLGGAISKESPVEIQILGKKWILHSTHKMDLIYALVACLILVTGLVFLW